MIMKPLWSVAKALLYAFDRSIIAGYLFAFGAIGLVWLVKQ